MGFSPSFFLGESFNISQHIIAVSFSSFSVVGLPSPGLFLPFFQRFLLIFFVSQLSCFELSFPLHRSPFLVLLSLHRSITSTPSISSLISLVSIQCVDMSFCSWICSSHLFQRSVKTASKVFWCQKCLP